MKLWLVDVEQKTSIEFFVAAENEAAASVEALRMFHDQENENPGDVEVDDAKVVYVAEIADVP